MKKTTSILAALVAIACFAPTVSQADNARFRFGAEIGAGFFPKEDYGLVLTALPSFGVQFNDLFGLVMMPGITIGGFNGVNDTIIDERFAYFNGIGLLDLTLGSGFQLGAGGGVDAGDLALCVEDAQICRVSRDVRGAFHARAALVPGFRTVRGRIGFPFAAHYHAPFYDGRPVHQMLFTVGVQRY